MGKKEGRELLLVEGGRWIRDRECALTNQKCDNVRSRVTARRSGTAIENRGERKRRKGSYWMLEKEGKNSRSETCRCASTNQYPGDRLR